jgi:hypothetical protein
MAHFLSMFDRSKYVTHLDLQGKDATVEIAKVEPGVVVGEGGKKSKKPLIWFKGKEKPYAASKTSAKTIASLYGTDTTAWVGKRVTLYTTTTEATVNGKRETVDCIRVRPTAPAGSKPTTPLPADPVETAGLDEPPADWQPTPVVVEP